MAIQTRRGLEADFDSSKMLPGEWAVSLDTKYVRMCFSPGVVMRMATYESFEEDMLQIQQILATCEDIQVAVEAFEVLAEQHANDAAASATASANSATESSDSAILSESWAIGNTGERPGENTNNAKYWSEVAQSAANVEIMTPTKLGIGKPDNITIGVNNGTFETKFKNYTSLADLGLTAPKTCLEIATAMPDNAQITLEISSHVTTSTVTDTPTNMGKLTIEKIHDSRCYAYFNEYTRNTDAPRMYVRYMRPSVNAISDWTEYLTTSRLTNNLLATVEGTALDAVQGKALDTRVTTNTNDIDTLNRNLSAAIGYNGKEIDLTWAQIEAKAAAGDFTDINIGDYKDIILTTGEKVRMEVAGLDTYYGYQSNNNHRIYFISRDCLATLYAMNSTDTNTGGFPASALKATLNGTIYNTLPAEIRNVIKTDKRLCSTKGSWAWQEDQKLWLPSEVEVWGHNTWSEVGYGNGCGIQFPIFTGSLRHICKGQGIGKAEQGSRVTWWCDSPNASNTTHFCGVNGSGYAYSYNASTALGVPLCFTL